MNNEQNSITNLLNQVRILSKKNRELEEERLIRGDCFNIFQDLGLISDEVHLHSSLIASLLNPRGSHGQGEKYLKAFLAMLSTMDRNFPLDFIDTDSKQVSVQVEKNIGPLTENSGGRIDLYITDSKHSIIIENKIYAGDQFHQMKRYWNYGMKNGKDSFKLIYLTLEGNNPAPESLVDLDETQYICLSYKHDIVSWLENSLQLSVSQPLVRETIVQYMNTIKILTNSNMNMNDELMEVLSKTENIDAVFDIFNSKEQFINYIINTRFIPRLKELAKAKGFELKTDVTDWFGTSWAGGSFYKNDWKYFTFSFEFDKRGLGDLIVGFLKKAEYDRSDINDWEKLQERFQSRDRKSKSWIWKSFEGKTYWNDKDVIKDLLAEKCQMLEDFKKSIDFALECAEGLDL